MKTGIKKLDLQGLVTLALFVAMDVVLGKISFGSLTLKAGLGFIGSALLAYYFGPLWGGIGALVSDLLRSAIFGVEGGFFPGFTLSAVVAVVIYALFLYQKPIKWWRIIASTLLVTLVVNVLMNTYWIHILRGLDLRAAFLQRILKELITPWIQIVVLYVILNALQRVKIRR